MTPLRTYSLGRRLTHFAAFGFGVGKAPVAPGTVGTLAAVPIYLILRETSLLLYGIATLAMFALGVWLCGATERDLGKRDMPEIVWDEMVGYLVAMCAAPRSWEWIVAGFVVFRLFDIVKPFPIRALERRVPGGFGIMLDDALAGLYTLLVLQMIVLLLA